MKEMGSAFYIVHERCPECTPYDCHDHPELATFDTLDEAEAYAQSVEHGEVERVAFPKEAQSE